MKAKLKYMAERAAGFRFWIGHSADRSRVENLIAALRPAGTIAPLVRVGSKGDGGYLLPDDLDGVTACVSPGVSVEIGFDQAMADRGIEVYMADASVEGPPQANERFHFTKKFLDVFEDETHMRLDSLCANIPDSGDLILQMDIEGAEYRVLLDADPETLKRFRIMAIEFHDLRDMFGRFSFDLIEATFRKILQTHRVVHIHPNNVARPAEFYDICVPQLLEITFLRKDRGFSDVRPNAFPHSLDVDNVPECPPLVLPEIWWK